MCDLRAAYLADPAFLAKLKQVTSGDPQHAMEAVTAVLGGGPGGLGAAPGAAPKDPRMTEVVMFLLSGMRGARGGAGGAGGAGGEGEEDEDDEDGGMGGDAFGSRGGAGGGGAAAYAAAVEQRERERREKERAERAEKERAEKERADKEREAELEAADGLTPEERAAKKARAAQAGAIKDEGNAHYKARRFDEALSAYRRAQELVPTDATFLLNESAVHFETGDFEQCIAVCRRAIELGRAEGSRAPFQTMAKIFARLGNAHAKRRELAEAIEAYESSMLEHRNDDVQLKLKALKVELKKKLEAEYQDPVKAEEAKEAGNEHFKAGRFDEAIKAYSEAVKRNPAEPRYLTNRAAAKAKRMDWQGSLEDAELALKLDPKNVKAMIKKGNAQFAQAQEYKAIDTFKAALALEPDNEEVKEGLRRTYRKVEDTNNDPARAEERRKRAMADPEIQVILNDPAVNNVLQDAQKDGKALARAMQNPGMREKILKLNAAGIIQISGM